MTDALFSRTPTVAQRVITYRLPPGADVLVRMGQVIGRDALLARVPRTPLIEAYAADLDTTPAEAFSALSVRDGARVRGGETVARRRNGLRTHTLNAATNGVITLRQRNGLYTLAPVVPTEIVSRFSGTVRGIAPDEITVRSFIERFPLRLASGDVSAEGALLALVDPRALPSTAAPDVLLIPHLAAFAALREAGRAGISLVIAGTVTDSIAWELLTTRTRAGTHAPRTPHVAAIAGPGDAAEGGRVFDALRAWDGRDVWLEDTGGTIAVCAEGRPGRPAPMPPVSAPLATTITLRDPAHWGQHAQIVSTARDAARDSGLISTVRIPNRGQLAVPMQNGEMLGEESH